jgi:hypothetical protein
VSPIVHASGKILPHAVICGLHMPLRPMGIESPRHTIDTLHDALRKFKCTEAISFQIVLCKGAAASHFVFAQPLFDKAATFRFFLI